MTTLTLNVTPRETGTSAARAVRREGLVPGVLYGAHQEPVHFAAEALSLRPLIHTTETYRVALKLDGEEFDCILKTVDYHPLTDAPIHLDFQALTAGEKLTMTIPVRLDGVAPGVKDEGGILSQPLGELEIRCLPKDIPGHLSVDISTLQIGDSLHVSDLAIGEEIEVLTDPARTIVTVTAPRIEEEPEPVDDLLLTGEEGLEGDPGAEAPEGDEASGDDEATE